MLKLSELLSKRLICLNSADFAGTISNIIFDQKLLAGKILKIYNDDGSETETGYVELKKVKNLEFDAGVISDRAYISREWDDSMGGAANPINCECFNQDGKALGVVRDVLLDGATVESILIDEKEFSPKNLLSYSDKLLIFNDTGAPIKLAKPKSRTAAVRTPAPEKAPQAAPERQKTAAEQDKAATEKQSADVGIPSRVPPQNTVVTRTPPQNEQPSPYKFLLGKRLSKNIRAENGALLLKEGSHITPDAIALMRSAGKLVQLALYAE
ncbi:MAG: PRC-barrel domain-containing protein [Clostridiales bacterium]|jgi:sporulation protein YlmC with PRC-barrel domain|nr:PRC-barrel domain-containing protein [Clostridiales bacterium]